VAAEALTELLSTAVMAAPVVVVAAVQAWAVMVVLVAVAVEAMRLAVDWADLVVAVAEITRDLAALEALPVAVVGHRYQQPADRAALVVSFFIGRKDIKMKYAWIENDKIRDVAHSNPIEIYHPDVAVFYTTQVPDDAVNGDGWVNGALVKPVVVEPTPAARQWTADNFRTGMTLAEKTKWDNDSAPEIKTVKAELPKELAGATELLDFLVASNVISQATATKILE
jgi:hypothetical protein